MNNSESDWDFIANIISGDKDVGESSGNKGNVSDSMLNPDFHAWNHIYSDSLSIGTIGEEDDHFQNAAGVFSSLQTHPTIQAERSIEFPKETAIEAADKEDSGEKEQKSNNELDNSKCLGEEVAGASQELRRKQNEQPTKRSAVHIMSERRRRERIRGKIRALQELIPNCNKRYEASILDDAIKYTKSLKLRVEMMSMARGALFQQVPYVAAAQFSPFMQFRPTPEMFQNGMYFSGLQLPQMSMPVMLPNLVPGFNYSSQGESSSRNVPTSSNINCQPSKSNANYKPAE